MKSRIVLRRIALYFLLTFTAFLANTSIFPLFTFFASAPNLLLIVIFTYGYMYGSTTGIICGIFAGILMDLFYPVLFGTYILIFSYLGFFSGMFHRELVRDSLVMPAVLIVIADFLYSIAMLFISYLTLGYADILHSFTYIILPEVFFTLLVTLLIYRVLLKAMRTLDSIEDLRGRGVA